MKTAGFDNFGASGQFYSALSGIPSSVLSGIGILTGLLVIGLGAWWLFQDTPEKDTADSASGDDSRSSPITQTSSEAPETATDTNEGGT